MARVLLHLLHGVSDELVGVHLVEVLHVTVVQQVRVGLHFLQVEQRWSLVRLVALVLFVPIKDVVLLLTLSGKALDKDVSQLVVVWCLIELVGENFFDEGQEGQGLRGFAKVLWRQVVLELLDSLELGLVELRFIIVLLIVAVLGQISEIAVDKVEHEVSKGDQIISSAVCQEIEAVLTGEDQVSLEEPFLDGGNVLSVRVDVLLS